MPTMKQSVSMSSLSSERVWYSYCSDSDSCSESSGSESNLELSRDTRNVTLTALTQSQRRNSLLVPQSYLPMADGEKKARDRAPGVEEKTEGTTQKRKRRKKNLVTANLTGTRYDVIRQVVEKFGFTVSKDDDPNSYFLWNDCFVTTERIAELKPYQRINHFPGMGEVTRKDALARNVMKMQKQHPDEYNFVPKTWILPSDHSLLQNYAKDLRARKKVKTFIVKPSNGAQGHGIQLFRNAEKIPPSEHFIVQEYIDKPLLLDGYKFDLRIYVLVTSCDPLRIFLFNDGLVRLATEKYLAPHENNVQHLFMHLTNYSVNKHNEFYEKSGSIDSGSKRSIKYLNEYLRRTDIDVALLWKNIADMIVKTLLLAEPHVLHAYRMCRPGVAPGTESVCFEILGFDVMIDRKLRPWLLEINRSPSFGTDEQLDYDIKSALIEDTIRLLNIKVSDKRKNIAALKAEAQRRLFRQTKKSEATDVSDLEKKRLSNERKKEELKDMLSRIRRSAAKEDFENRNCGRFRRIFPSEDKAKQERYCSLLGSAFSIFLSGRGTNMAREIDRTYNNRLREEDVLDMLNECEADEDGKSYPGGRRGPKPLQSMPESGPTRARYDEEASEDSTPPTSPPSRRPASYTNPRSRPHSMAQRSESRQSQGDGALGGGGRLDSIVASAPLQGNTRPQSNMSTGPGRTRSLTRTQSKPGPQPKATVRRVTIAPKTVTAVHLESTLKSTSVGLRLGSGESGKTENPLESLLTCHRLYIKKARITPLPSPPKPSSLPNNSCREPDKDDLMLSNSIREREEELTSKTLLQLNDMRIKFPGKTDQEADLLLDKLHENWKFHKPRIASYWLVKLDSIKRRKVIDIVRSNVKAVLQRIWRCSDVDNLKVYRIFSRVFNRLLWSHGQGLWNCFTSMGYAPGGKTPKPDRSVPLWDDTAVNKELERLMTSRNTWETIFSKGSDSITETEMNCCRRIVQLCRDCLLIVYQFAAEAKGSSQHSEASDENHSVPASLPQNGYLTGRDLKPPASWNPQTFSQRYSKLYQPAGLGS